MGRENLICRLCGKRLAPPVCHDDPIIGNGICDKCLSEEKIEVCTKEGEKDDEFY